MSNIEFSILNIPLYEVVHLATLTLSYHNIIAVSAANTSFSANKCEIYKAAINLEDGQTYKAQLELNAALQHAVKIGYTRLQ